MPISRTAILFLIFVLMLSVFVASISNLISIGGSTPVTSSLRRIEDTEPNSDSRVNNITLGEAPEHLIWFIQISDIHISIFHDETRVTQLKEFCDVTLDAIKPSVVLASGDLTDAKSEDNMGSRQYVEEWEAYKNVLQACRVTEKTVWLDIRGNHDNFNVPSLTSEYNYYRNYSIQGRAHPRSYMYQIKTGRELYSFIGVDACLDPGPRRPFNFVGVLSQAEMDYVMKLSDDAKKKGSNNIIWFGHYPTSCILAPGPGGVRALIAKYPESIVYVCGHYHTLGGMVPNMYTLQQAGFLELELGDWKDNRMYRVLAVDHGMFSFVDVKHGDWPVTVVTNPKHALFMMPTREPVRRVLQSTHIRVLGFSISPIESIAVKMDDGYWQNCTHVKGPLYVLPWDPNLYATGIHQIHVIIKDVAGRQKITTQPFSLDGTRMSFQVLPRLALMSNVSSVFQFLFGTGLSLCVLPLCILKFLHKLVKARKLQRPRLSIHFFQNWIRKMWILSTVDRVFYPLVLYALYLTAGFCRNVDEICALLGYYAASSDSYIPTFWDNVLVPSSRVKTCEDGTDTLSRNISPWSIGEVIEGYTGIIFAWGIIVNGTYLPGSFTYAYGFLQMCTFQLPMTLILAHSVDVRCTSHLTGKSSLLDRLCQHVPFIIVLTVQLEFAYFFWLSYGTMAFLLGPLRTWSVLLGIVLWHQSATLSEKSLQDAAAVWGNRHVTASSSQECKLPCLNTTVT